MTVCYQFWWPFATRRRIELQFHTAPGSKRSSKLHKMYQCRCMAKNSWWVAERLPETCTVVIPIKLEFSASVGFIHKPWMVINTKSYFDGKCPPMDALPHCLAVDEAKKPVPFRWERTFQVRVVACLRISCDIKCEVLQMLVLPRVIIVL